MQTWYWYWTGIGFFIKFFALFFASNMKVNVGNTSIRKILLGYNYSLLLNEIKNIPSCTILQ